MLNQHVSLSSSARPFSSSTMMCLNFRQHLLASVITLISIKIVSLKMNTPSKYAVCLAACLYLLIQQQYLEACRVGSEKLKNYTKKSIERLLDTEFLDSFYWPEEPLDHVALSKATGLNITLAETRFDLGKKEATRGMKQDLLLDMFVTCATGRDRIYTLALNLEITNPFNVIDVHFRHPSDSNLEEGLFSIRLPQSTFLLQLSQRINYDECLVVNHIQLAPNISYEVLCKDCRDFQQSNLDRVFSKRMTQLDAELDLMLSEKLLLGLQTLLSQERLDLDLYLVGRE